MPITNKIASLDDLIQKNGSDQDGLPTEQLANKIKEINISQSEKNVIAQARKLGLGYIDLSNFPISPESLVLIDRNESENLGAICFFRTDKDVRIGTTNPQNKDVIEFINQLKEKYFKMNISLYMISAYSFARALKLYDVLPKIRKTVSGVKITQADLDEFSIDDFTNFDALQKKITDVSMTKVINLLVAASLSMRASDIHIEAEQEDIVIRYRIDGILHEVSRLSMNIWTKVIARIKILSGLKINITNRPQDGRFTISANEVIDVRVSTLPTAFGESVVMRLLRSSVASLQFEQLGIEGSAHTSLKTQIERSNGMIITTGPTGSGKTTTLYAIVNQLNDKETKIITLEDPIEYKIKGISQSQIAEGVDTGYTFADGLRSILRQDPDVIMVGEIRDLETADTAINAALTGHLVISTIHTNSAAAAIPRFLAMGVKAFLLAPSLNAIIGQRLCRRICPQCKRETTPDQEILEKVNQVLKSIPDNNERKPDLNNLKFYKGGGCTACQGLGYKGRVGIYEIFTMSPEVEKVILSGKVSEYEIQDIAIKQGMITMVQDGILKALAGITTADEVFRVSE
jgi:type II secretory ATPase GspE/PulE/Tfp pilus assembly ATPase PilB-like protein